MPAWEPPRSTLLPVFLDLLDGRFFRQLQDPLPRQVHVVPVIAVVAVLCLQLPVARILVAVRREEHLELLDRRASQPGVHILAGRGEILAGARSHLAQADEDPAPVVRHPGGWVQTGSGAYEVNRID